MFYISIPQRLSFFLLLYIYTNIGIYFKRFPGNKVRFSPGDNPIYKLHRNCILHFPIPVDPSRLARDVRQVNWQVRNHYFVQDRGKWIKKGKKAPRLNRGQASRQNLLAIASRVHGMRAFSGAPVAPSFEGLEKSNFHWWETFHLEMKNHGKLLVVK